jgi:ABC-2 type transport system permease protein
MPRPVDPDPKALTAHRARSKTLDPSKILTLARYEFASFWSGPTGALALLVFLGLEGLVFNNSVASYALANLGAMSRGGAIDATLTMFSAGLSDLGLLLALVSPLATMRSFSVSAHGGHLDLLTSWPISRYGLTLSLHLAACGTLALLAILGLAPYILLMAMGVGGPWLLVPAIIGLAFAILSYSALGLAVSSLTRKPVPAALTTLGLLGFMWAIGWAAPYLPAKAGALIQGLAIGPRLSHFTLGLLDTNDILYFIVLTLCCLFVAKPVRS